MDHIRNALIAGLAIVSYLLLLAWNEDYPQQQATPSVRTEQQSGQQPPTDLPTTAGQEAPDEQDLPSVPTTEQQRPAVAAETPRAQLISVSTPVHRVLIDPVGGDIVRVTLPDYPVSMDRPDDPFVLLRNDETGTYVAQSGLVGADGPDAAPTGRPVYESSQTAYTLEEGELNVDLSYTTPDGVMITKRFTFDAEDYLIEVDYLIENQSGEPWATNLFGQIKRDGSSDPNAVGGMGMRDYLGAVLTTPDDPYKTVELDDIDRGGTQDIVAGGWIAFSQHYFLGAWIPPGDQTNTFTTRKNTAGEYIMGFVSPQTVVSPGESTVIESSFWAGPKDQYRLKEIHPNLDLTIDYGWLWFIASPLFWLLNQINNIFGNWGWSIIGLTIVIKLIFSKLSATSYRSMAKMRRLTPKIAQLRDRYGDDKQKLMQAQMELWKKEKVNPLGGCLPMLLQMPVLIGIYWVLNKSVELRHAEWILWYDDLSAMDPYFILPLIMGASMFVSQLMTPITTADPMQAKIMRLMPVIFTVFFLWFPAGLVLYWLVSNLFNIAQQWYINKKVDEEYEKRAG